MIDCHAHMACANFSENLKIKIEEAKNSGVKGVIVVPVDYSEFRRTIEICDQYPDFLCPALGLHPIQGSYSNPDETKPASRDHFNEAAEFIEQNIERIVCIGETGLDFTPKFIRNEKDKLNQIECFKCQIEIAKKYNLPLNIHSRSAAPQIFKLLDQFQYYNCLFHAYGNCILN